MIVLDIETSGKYTTGYGIWQIGAIDLNTGKEFLEEARIDDEDRILEDALKITGKTEEELRDNSKQAQKEMIKHLLAWLKNCKERVIAGQNVWWDLIFLQNKCVQYELIREFEETLSHRVIDLSTLAQINYRKQNGNFKTDKEKDAMNLKSVLEMCGIKDERKQHINGKVSEGKPHNAMEDCKLEAECFKRLLK